MGWGCESGFGKNWGGEGGSPGAERCGIEVSRGVRRVKVKIQPRSRGLTGEGGGRCLL